PDPCSPLARTRPRRPESGISPGAAGSAHSLTCTGGEPVHTQIGTARPDAQPTRSSAGSPARRLGRLLLAIGLVTALAGGLTFGAAVIGGRSGPPPSSDPVSAAAFDQLSAKSL